MKVLLMTSLLVSVSAFAQDVNVATLKTLFTQNQTTLEKVNPGMSKKTVTKSKAETESGLCDFTQTSTQTIMKIEGTKMIIHAVESFEPTESPECTDAGLEAFEETLLYYENVPTLASDLSDLDASAKDIKTISRKGNLVSMSLTDPETREDVNLQYDLTKSSFKNLISSKSEDTSIETLDIVDVDVNSFDLTDILFCDNNDGDNSDCSEGDFSDILF